MLFCILLINFLLMSTSFLSSKHRYFEKKDVIVTGGFESKNSFIIYLTINGKQYILKQKKDVEKKLPIIQEALGAYIAKHLDIAHSVKIISAKDKVPGKKYPELPATLHTIVPGKPVRDQPESRYCKLSLKQRSPEDELLTGRWLTEKIIHQITWHKQLPVIIALDLFLSNIDRHGGNLFYDPITDRFWAIDMDCIFRWDVSSFACKKLDLMINIYKKRFTREEIEALTVVRDTLRFLLKKYPLQKIITKFYQLLGQTDCAVHPIQTGRFEAMIGKSLESTRTLVNMLDNIINDFN